MGTLPRRPNLGACHLYKLIRLLRTRPLLSALVVLSSSPSPLLSFAVVLSSSPSPLILSSSPSSPSLSRSVSIRPALSLRNPRPPSMADQLTDDQISEFKEAFSLFDKDGDGYFWHEPSLQSLRMHLDCAC